MCADRKLVAVIYCLPHGKDKELSRFAEVDEAADEDQEIYGRE